MRNLFTTSALLLALVAGQAQAASYDLTGAVDSGPLAGTANASFSGSFAFDDPVAGFDGDVTLTRLTLDFNGQQYTLASAQAGSTPTAMFVAGMLSGVSFAAFSVGPGGMPYSPVQLNPDWYGTGTYTLSYDLSGQNTVEGFGSYAFTPSAVPEPGSHALLLAGLAGIAVLARRRQRA